VGGVSLAGCWRDPEDLNGVAVGVSCYNFWNSLQEVKEEVVEEGEELEEEELEEEGEGEEEKEEEE